MYILIIILVILTRNHVSYVLRFRIFFNGGEHFWDPSEPAEPDFGSLDPGL